MAVFNSYVELSEGNYVVTSPRTLIQSAVTPRTMVPWLLVKPPSLAIFGSLLRGIFLKRGVYKMETVQKKSSFLSTPRVLDTLLTSHLPRYFQCTPACVVPLFAPTNGRPVFLSAFTESCGYEAPMGPFQSGRSGAFIPDRLEKVKCLNSEIHVHLGLFP